MKKIVPFFILISLSSAVWAQDASLLQNYKFRTKRYNALNLLFNSGAQKSHGNNSFSMQDASAASFSGGGNLLSFKSTDKTLQIINANLPVSGSFSKYSNSPNIERNRQVNILSDFDLNQKWFSPNKNFRELGFTANSAYSANTERQTINNPYTTKNQQRNLNISTTIGFGKGRLENITDMQNALWLQKALQEEGLLKTGLTAKEANGLAQTITKASNFRILDGRRRTRYLLKAVDNYINENNLVNKRDIDYFTNLNDILFFANNFQRLSGAEKYIRITPGWGTEYNNYFQNNSSNNFSNNNTLQKTAIELKIGYQKYKPIDLKRQFNYGVELKGGFFSNTNKVKQFNNGVLTNLFTSKYEEKRAGLLYFLQYSMYPNSRTVVNFNLNGENGVSNAANGTHFYHQNKASVNGNYFINYNTSLFFDVGVQNQSNHFNNSLRNSSNNLFFNVGVRIGL